MAAMAALAAAGWRQGLPAWRAALCTLQHVCLQPAGLQQQLVQAASMTPWPAVPGDRSLASGPWATKPDRAQQPWHSQQQRQRQQQQWSVPLSMHQLVHRQLINTQSKDSDASSGSGNGGAAATEQRRRRERRRAAEAAAALQAVGWSRQEVFNLPNALSMARLLSGPLIASWIIDAQWSLALPALAVSGASDWADGWVARRFNQPSVIGSYLDPLADKVLICSVVGALGWSGVLSAPVVGIIVGRDVLIVGGTFAARFQSLGWRWPGAAEFFRVQPPATAAQKEAAAAAAAEAAAAAAAAGAADGRDPAAAAAGPAPPAPLAQPLFISKVNTVFQLGLVGTCILDSWLGWPGSTAVMAASAATAGTTVWSCWAYLQAYLAGTALGPRPTQH